MGNVFSMRKEKDFIKKCKKYVDDLEIGGDIENHSCNEPWLFKDDDCPVCKYLA